ncbi:MAG TPA: STT3 domain-containing protein [Armatimonadota bacterium]|jgi:asparagine N-glycosylation enzyme membrane subunit Stt3
MILCLALRASNERYLPPERYFDGDSVRFCRLAGMIADGRPVGAADTGRWLPEGRSLTRYPAVSSYALAGLYRAGNSVSRSWTLDRAAYWYPVLCFLLGLPAVYWLCRRLSSPACARAVCALYCLLPIGVRHSVVAYCDRDALVLSLSTTALALYLASLEAAGRRRWGLTLASALAMGLLAHTWEGFGLFTSVVIFGYLLQSLMGRATRAESEGLMLWSVVVMAVMAGYQETYRPPFQAYTALAWLAPLTGLAWAGVDRLLRRGGEPAPSWALVAGRLAAVVAPIVLVVGVWAEAPAALLEHLVAPLGHNRLMMTVGELQKPGLAEWYGAFHLTGWLSVVGAAALSFQLGGGSRSRWGAAASVLGFVFFAVVAPGLLSGGRFGTDSLFAVSLAMWALGWLVTYLGARRRGREEPEAVAPEAAELKSAPYLLAWFLIMLAAARSSVRFEIWLLPVACALSAMVLSEVAWQLSPEHASEFLFGAATLACAVGVLLYLVLSTGLSPIVAVLLALGLALPLVGRGVKRPKVGWLFEQVWPVLLVVGMLPVGLGYGAQGANRLAGLGQTYMAHLSGPLKWLREKAPDSIVAAWWDYGSWINYFGHARTIIDEDHYRPYRIHLFARHVYGASDPGDALSFLRAYRANYLLLTRTDLGICGPISLIGMLGPKGNGVDLLSMPLPRQVKLGNGHLLLDSAAPVLWPYGQKAGLGVMASVELDSTGKRPMGGSFVLLDGRSEEAKVPRFVVVDGERLNLPKSTSPYGLVCQSVKVGDRTLRTLYVVGPEHEKLLAVRLFLLQERVPGFAPVFRDGFNALWRVEPGPAVKPNPAYLGTDFPTPELKRRWTSTSGGGA